MVFTIARYLVDAVMNSGFISSERTLVDAVMSSGFISFEGTIVDNKMVWVIPSMLHTRTESERQYGIRLLQVLTNRGPRLHKGMYHQMRDADQQI